MSPPHEFYEDAMAMQPILADGCVINGQILITSYFDPDGQLKYVVGNAGNLNLAQALGLLELAKIAAYSDYMRNEPYSADEPDDDEDEEEEDER